MSASVGEVDASSGLGTLWYRVYLPNLLFATGQGAILPVLALAARQVGASTSIAGVIVGANGFGTMIFDLPAGWIVARLGEVRAQWVAALMLVGGLGDCLAAHSVLALGVGIFVQSGGWALWSLVRLTHLSRITTAAIRGRALSVFGGMMRCGQVIGPFIVAAVATAKSVRVSFLIYLLCAAVGFLWLQIARDHADHAARLSSPGRVRPIRIVRANQHEFATAGVTTYAIGMLRASRQVVVPLWGAHLGLGGEQVSLIYGISSILDLSLFYPAGIVSDRFGRKAVAVPCIGLLALGHLLLPLAHAEVSLLLVALVLGAGNGLGAGIVMTLGADRAPSEGRPAFLSVWRFVADAGTASGPLVDAAVIGVATLAIAAPVVGIIGAGATLVAWRFLEETAAPTAAPRARATVHPRAGPSVPDHR